MELEAGSGTDPLPRLSLDPLYPRLSYVIHRQGVVQIEHEWLRELAEWFEVGTVPIHAVTCG